MAQGPYDISKGVFVIDGLTATEKTEGDFLTISGKALIAGQPGQGSRSVVDRVHAQDREGQITCGWGSAWYSILGGLLDAQTQRIEADPEWGGFTASYRYGGHVSISGTLLFREEPEIVQNGSSQAWVWPVIWRETVAQYGVNA